MYFRAILDQFKEISNLNQQIDLKICLGTYILKKRQLMQSQVYWRWLQEIFVQQARPKHFKTISPSNNVSKFQSFNQAILTSFLSYCSQILTNNGVEPQACICKTNQTKLQNLSRAKFNQTIKVAKQSSAVIQIQSLNKMIEHLNKLFMAVIVLSLFTYFQRPDYNLPLFAFIILLWDNAYVKQKTRIWYLMAVSLFVDLVWIIYWSVTWGGYNNREAGLCNFTVFISVFVFIIKLVILILTYVKVDDCKKAVSQFGSNLKYVFKGPSAGGYEPVE